MFWDLHGLTLQADWNNSDLGDRWLASFASLNETQNAADLTFTLNLVPAVPPPPSGAPQFRQNDLLEYYLSADHVVAHFPRYGQLRLDLLTGTTVGEVTQAALDTYGVFEDLVAIGLSPHLRRRGQFLIHAFAACPPNTKCVLIVGRIGSGKTTTGMALLNAGWKLLSNDSPIISTQAQVLSYPGLLAAYPNTLARFDSTRSLSLNADPAHKIIVGAESIWPEVWAEQAAPGAILFPHIEARTEHLLEPLSQPEALRLILPHAIEQWDKQMIPTHLAALNQLIQAAPAYRLRLGPDTSTVPGLLNLLLNPHPARS
jgi:hypothetical protein